MITVGGRKPRARVSCERDWGRNQDPPREEVVRLRSLRELRRDSLRIQVCSLKRRSAREARPTQPKLARSASEGWLAALDDFRNWLIREAA